MARVAVVFTGGTISMRIDPVAGGNVPTLDGAAILARTPGLDEIADVVPIDRGLTPASHFTFPALFEICAAIRARRSPTRRSTAPSSSRARTRSRRRRSSSTCSTPAPKPVVVTGAMRASRASRSTTARPTCATPSGPRPPPVAARRRASSSCLAGTIEPADDVTKTHASAFDTFRSLNAGPLGRVEAGEVTSSRASARAAPPRRRPTRAAERVHLVTATVAMDGTPIDALRRGRRRRVRRRGDRRRQHVAGAARGRGAGDGRRAAGRARRRAARRGGAGRPTRSRAAARRGSGPARSSAGHLGGPKARVALALGLGAGLDRDGLAALLADPTSTPGHAEGAMPLDALVTGRIATLAGDAGFGWVEAVGITRRPRRVRRLGGRARDAGRPVHRRIELEPDEVAIPGLTDAHLHLAEGGDRARTRSTCRDAATLDDGPRADPRRPRALADPTAWLEGHGWDSDRWGRWPTADDLERVAPGRRCRAVGPRPPRAAGRAARRSRRPGSTRDTADPAGGIIRRDARRRADGRPPRGGRPARRDTSSRRSSGASATSAAHRRARCELVAPRRRRGPRSGRAVAPGCASAGDRRRTASLASAAACRSGSTPASATSSSTRRSRGGLRSGDPLGAGPTVGAVRLAEAASPTGRSARGRRRSSSRSSPRPDRPLPPGTERGVWITDARAARRARDARPPARDRDADPRDRRRGVRAALDALEPTAARVPLMPRLEHVQLLHPDDRGRLRRGRDRGLRPAGPSPGRRRAGPPAVGRPRRDERLPVGARSRTTGAVLAFGTDAPVEPIDPWPGLAMAVTRADPRWPAGTPPFGPDEALTLERALRAACVGPARHGRASPIAAGSFRGQRADLVVIPVGGPDGAGRAGRRARDGPPAARPRRRRGRLRGLASSLTAGRRRGSRCLVQLARARRRTGR